MTIDYSTSPLLLSILLPKFIDFSMFLRLFNTKKTPQRLIKFSLCAFNYRRCDFFEILFSVIRFCLFEPLLCSPHLSATNVILSCLFLIVNTFYIFYFICTIGTIRLPFTVISYLLSLMDLPSISLFQ